MQVKDRLKTTSRLPGAVLLIAHLYANYITIE